DVVEDTESLAVVGEGVVRAAGEVHGDPVIERCACRFASAADGAKRAFDERLGRGEPEPPQLRVRKATADESIDVVSVVYEQQVLARDARRLVQMLRRHDPVTDHALAQPLVFRDRKAVAGWERKCVARRGPGVHESKKARPREGRNRENSATAKT